MDKAADRKAMAELIRRCMPQVAVLMAAKRAELGDAHVTECQQRGMRGEPGWFYAAEGPLAVGTPWADNAVIADLLAARITPTQAIVVLRPKTGAAPC